MSKGLIISIVLAIIFIVLVIIAWKRKKSIEASNTIEDFTGNTRGTVIPPIQYGVNDPRVGLIRPGADKPIVVGGVRNGASIV